MKFIVNGTPVEIEETVENLRECANALKRDCLKHKRYKSDEYTCDKECFRYNTCLFTNNNIPIL